ncbi:hypothetical protein AB1Y20_009365 [Prymnesium parvum]|uniref:Uncharacterized protein n=1 Tax=Prymnesium parvum TaxID=97485 RepID=A0AB34K6C6_PRYPA
MGGPAPGAPPLPVGAANVKMARLKDTRMKAAYGLIYKHISDGDLRTILYTNCFQDGRAALLFLDAAYDTPITRSELREMDKLWTELSIAQDVGISADSVSRFGKLVSWHEPHPVGGRDRCRLAPGFLGHEQGASLGRAYGERVACPRRLP